MGNENGLCDVRMSIRGGTIGKVCDLEEVYLIAQFLRANTNSRRCDTTMYLKNQYLMKLEEV